MTDAVVFIDYTILHLTDRPDCAVDLLSLQHLTASWLSEFLTELRNDSLHFHFTLRLRCVLDGCLWRYSCTGFSSDTGFSSEILLKNFIRDPHSGFWLSSLCSVMFFCSGSFVRNFRRRLLDRLCGFCQDVIFLRTISTRSLRVLIVRAIIEL